MKRIRWWIVCVAILILCIGIAGFLLHRTHEVVLPPPPQTATLATQEMYWSARIKAIGGEAAYKEFEAFVAPLTANQKHTEAHVFGGALYAVEGLSGISVCDTQFSFGCFHELLGRAIAAMGLSAVSQLNVMCFKVGGNYPLSCQHGIGHGIVSDIGYDLSSLKKSLALCATLPNADPIGGCYAGVYMEYNSQTMLGSDGHIRPATADLFAPCDQIVTSDQPACYFWQPQWWHAIFDPESDQDNTQVYAKIGALCAQLSGDVRQRCFEGVGNNIPTDVAQPTASVENAVRGLCDAAAPNPQDRLYCLSLAANSLTNAGAGIRGSAEKVCTGLPADQYRYCMSYGTNSHDSVSMVNLEE